MGVLGLMACSVLAVTPEAIGNDDIVVPAPPSGVSLQVMPDEDVGPIKPMNAVNNGPNVVKSAEGFHPWRRFDDFRALNVPMTRTHDSRFTVGNPGRLNDIALIFPNFDADENDPANFDFALTDEYLNTIRLMGADIMYFLGSSSDTEMGGRNYGTDEPPKDFAKWARIAERVIRHYNEGWGWTNADIPFSNQFNIVHWELWNEPDLDCGDEYWTHGVKTWEQRRRYWHGSPEQFFEFYGVAATYLKKQFPNLKFGGPALAGRTGWADRFLGYCETNSVPLDFFSWHGYNTEPLAYARLARTFRELLDKHGFKNVPSILNEWNWNIGWSGDDVRESVYRRGEMNNYRIAAYYSAVMCALQHEPVDMLMYYDTRVPCLYNGLFSSNAELPLKGYYSFYAWSKLRQRGREVRTRLVGDVPDVYAVSAKGEDGSVAILLARCSQHGGECRPIPDCRPIPVHLVVKGRTFKTARLHVTDELERYTERTLRILADGSARFRLAPYAFAVIEIP